MYETVCPLGGRILIPENSTEDWPSFTIGELDRAVPSYLEHGFAIVREAIPKAACQRVTDRLKADIKPYKGLLPRIGGKDEVNKLNESGFIANTLSNLQNSRIVPHSIDGYVEATLDVLTHTNLLAFHREILKSEITLISWNHFEGNPVTIPHHDSFFWGQDLAIGEVVGAWVALEDIQPGAGRLYVYPESHKSDFREFAASTAKNGGVLNVAESSYRNLVIDYLKTCGIECKAPSLKAGDVLFWDSRVIHGSLVTSQPQYSRSSFTAHFGSLKSRFSYFREQRQKVRNGVAVTYPKVFSKEAISAKFPKAYKMAKSLLGRAG